MLSESSALKLFGAILLSGAAGYALFSLDTPPSHRMTTYTSTGSAICAVPESIGGGHCSSSVHAKVGKGVGYPMNTTEDFSSFGEYRYPRTVDLPSRLAEKPEDKPSRPKSSAPVDHPHSREKPPELPIKRSRVDTPHAASTPPSTSRHATPGRASSSVDSKRAGPEGKDQHADAPLEGQRKDALENNPKPKHERPQIVADDEKVSSAAHSTAGALTPPRLETHRSSQVSEDDVDFGLERLFQIPPSTHPSNPHRPVTQPAPAESDPFSKGFYLEVLFKQAPPVITHRVKHKRTVKHTPVKRKRPRISHSSTAYNSPMRKKILEGSIPSVEKALLNAQKLTELKAEIERINLKFDKNETLRLWRRIDSALNSKLSSPAKRFYSRRPIKKNQDLVKFEKVLTTFPATLNNRQLGQIERFVSKRNASGLSVALEPVRKQLTETKFTSFLLALDKTFRGSTVFKEVVALDKKRAAHVNVSDIKFTVKTNTSSGTEHSSEKGESSDNSPPPAPPPPPSTFALGGGFAQTIKKKFDIRPRSSLLEEIKYEQRRKRLVISKDTIFNLIGSWLQERVDSRGLSHDVNGHMEKNKAAFINAGSFAILADTIAGSIEFFTKGKKPIFTSTQDLRDELVKLLSKVLENKVNPQLVEGNINDSIKKLVETAIGVGSVEKARVDFLAGKLSRALKLSAKHDEVKNIIRFLAACNVNAYDDLVSMASFNKLEEYARKKVGKSFKKKKELELLLQKLQVGTKLNSTFKSKFKASTSRIKQVKESQELRIIISYLQKYPGVEVNSRQRGLLNWYLSSGDEDKVANILSSFKRNINKKNDQTPYLKFMRNLHGQLAKLGKPILAEALEKEERVALLIDIRQTKISVRKKPTVETSSDRFPPAPPPPPGQGHDMATPPPAPPPAPPPSPSTKGFGTLKPPPVFNPLALISKKLTFKPKGMEDIRKDVEFSFKTNELIVGENTLDELVGSWLQRRVIEVSSVHNVQSILSRTRTQRKNVRSIPSLIAYLGELVTALVSEDIPLYQTTGSLHSSAFHLVKDFLGDLIDKEHFEKGFDKEIDSLISDTIKAGLVEKKRDEYIANQLALRFKATRYKDQLKSLVSAMRKHVPNRDKTKETKLGNKTPTTPAKVPVQRTSLDDKYQPKMGLVR